MFLPKQHINFILLWESASANKQIVINVNGCVLIEKECFNTSDDNVALVVKNYCYM